MENKINAMEDVYSLPESSSKKEWIKPELTTLPIESFGGGGLESATGGS